MNRRLIFSFFFLTLAPQVFAQVQTPVGYRVELIVFENLKPETKETWPEDPGVPSSIEAVELTTIGLPKSSISVDNTRELKDIATRLNASSAYRTVLHVAWRQAIGTTAKPIHLVTAPFEALVSREVKVLVPGQQEPLDPIVDAVESYNNGPRPPAGIEEKSVSETIAKQMRVIDGIAKLSVDRFIDIDVDIVLTKQLQNNEQPQLATWQSYRLKERRRLKAKELNYLDHPQFGVVFVITPVNSL